MPLAPHQFLLATVELLLLLGGAWWLARTLAVPATRTATFGTNRVPPWPLAGFEVAFLVVTIFLCGFLGQMLAVQFLGDVVRESPNRAGFEVVLFGLGFHGAALLAWPLFRVARRLLHTNYGATPPAATHPRPLGVDRYLRQGAATLVLVLPAVTIASLGWTTLLRAVGLPDEPQDLIAVFGSVDSPLILIAMLVVACVVAPLNEELIFRGTIFRFCRQRFGRGFAIIVSSVLFGALHGNWAGFFPLAVLGAGLCLAYEYSGDIRVPVVAHGLFNLNSILVIVSGLPNT